MYEIIKTKNGPYLENEAIFDGRSFHVFVPLKEAIGVALTGKNVMLIRTRNTNTHVDTLAEVPFDVQREALACMAEVKTIIGGEYVG